MDFSFPYSLPFGILFQWLKAGITAHALNRKALSILLFLCMAEI